MRRPTKEAFVALWFGEEHLWRWPGPKGYLGDGTGAVALSGSGHMLGLASTEGAGWGLMTMGYGEDRHGGSPCPDIASWEDE